MHNVITQGPDWSKACSNNARTSCPPINMATHNINNYILQSLFSFILSLKMNDASVPACCKYLQQWWGKYPTSVASPYFSKAVEAIWGVVAQVIPLCYNTVDLAGFIGCDTFISCNAETQAKLNSQPIMQQWNYWFSTWLIPVLFSELMIVIFIILINYLLLPAVIWF